ncbi:MAG: hypothetical protein HY314_07345 [Acidobacteria bacterium]|nr:hypothetical protein [Acidobacteriota bacterium]
MLILPWSPANLAQNQPDAAGRWEGAINIQGTKLGVNVGLSRKADNTWTGKIDIPAQGAKDLPLANITVEGAAVSF